MPALFAHWSPILAEAARIGRGDRVLDVACGTGTAARAAAARSGHGGMVTGLDIAPGMLAVARGLDPQIAWRHGSADALPFDDGSFDCVLCQFGLMFFADPVAAIGEMLRVLRPGGRLALATWDSLALNPGYAEKVAILERIAGRRAADALRAPFVMGDGEALCSLARAAGVRDPELHTIEGRARFGSLEEFVDADLRGWLPVLGVHLDEDTIGRVLEHCRRDLRGYVDKGDGSIRLPTSAHIVRGVR